MAFDVGSIIAHLKLDTAQFQSGVSEASSTAEGGGLSMGKLAAGVALGQAAFFALQQGMNAVVGGVKDVVTSFEEQQNTQAQLKAALDSTHGAAGLFVEDLNDQADALQNVTTYSHEQISASQALLLTFTDIHGAVFQKTTPVILDLATAMHEDLQSATVQVGKAMNNPITGMTALQRVGVTFSAAQKQVITDMENTGNMAGAQGIILAELQKEFGGSAQAAGSTFSGSLEKLKNKMDDVKQSIGGAIITAITPFINKLAAFVSSDKFQSWLDVLSTKYVPMFVNALVGTVDVVMKVISIIASVIGWFEKHKTTTEILTGVLVGLVAAFATFEIITGIIALIQGITVAVAAFGTVVLFVTSPIGIIVIAIGLLAAGAFLVIKNWGAVSGFFAGLWKDVSKFFGDHIVDILAVIFPFIGIPLEILKHWQPIVNFFEGLLGTIGKFFGGLGSAKGALHDLHIPGFAAGVTNFAGGLAMVGEHGPELVNLPAGSSVTPNNQIGQAGGGGVSLQVQGDLNIGSDYDVDSMMKRIQRNVELQRQGGSAV